MLRAREAYFTVLSDSSRFVSDGLAQATTVVLELPPRLS